MYTIDIVYISNIEYNILCFFCQVNYIYRQLFCVKYIYFVLPIRDYGPIVNLFVKFT